MLNINIYKIVRVLQVNKNPKSVILQQTQENKF